MEIQKPKWNTPAFEEVFKRYLHVLTKEMKTKQSKMQFTYNGSTYRLSFQYDRDTENRYRVFRPAPNVSVYIDTCTYTFKTTAKLFEIDSTTDKVIRVVSTGVATCNPNDKFTKESGRTHAIRNMLADDFSLRQGSVVNLPEFKALIWSTYHNRKGNKNG